MSGRSSLGLAIDPLAKLLASPLRATVWDLPGHERLELHPLMSETPGMAACDVPPPG